MSFHSLEYAIFFVVVFLVFWGLQRFGIGKLVFLTIMSWGFYATESPWGLVLLLIATFVDFFVALKMDAEEDQKRRKLWLMVSVVSNLSLLGYFKYANFFQETVVDVANLFGADLHFVRWDIFLPAGISFYTFMTLSYTVDVYRREIPVERNFIRFAFFIGFFAHLLAGPIVRARDLLPQIPKKSFISSQQVSRALWLILLGVAKKVIVADPLERDVVGRVFTSPDFVTGADTMVALFAYTARIYYDFSAYSDIAIGSALLLGYHLPDNFDRPYAAQSISNFWRRWHMTMSSFLRDYVFFPLGGSRGKDWQVYRNLFVTFFLIGLWHGASWNFALYGTGHALAMCLHRWLRKRGPDPALPFAFGVASFVAVITLAIGLRLELAPGVIIATTALAFALSTVIGVLAGKHVAHPDRVGRVFGATAFGVVIGTFVATMLDVDQKIANAIGAGTGVAAGAFASVFQKRPEVLGPTLGFGAIGAIAGLALGLMLGDHEVALATTGAAALAGGMLGWHTAGEAPPSIALGVGVGLVLAVVLAAVGLGHGVGLTLVLASGGYALGQAVALLIGKRLSYAQRVGRALAWGACFAVCGAVAATLLGLGGVLAIVVGGAFGVGFGALTFLLGHAPGKVNATLGLALFGAIIGLASGVALGVHAGLTWAFIAAGAALGVTIGRFEPEPVAAADDEGGKVDAWGVTWRVGLTLGFVILMRVLFRAAEIEHGQPPKTSEEAWNIAVHVSDRLINGPWTQVSVMSPWLWVVLVGSYVIHLSPRSWLEATWQAYRRMPFILQGAVLAALTLLIAALTDGRPLPFAYVQF